MTWVRKDDQMPIHRKVAPLSDAAYRLEDEAMCWASRNGTDGRIGTADLPYTSKRGQPRYAAELVARGLWHVAGEQCASEKCATSGPDGWVIHDYLAYNPSAEQVRHERDLKAKRQARWRDAKSGRRSDGASTPSERGDVDGRADASVTLAPYPSRPAPKGSGAGTPRATARRLTADAGGGREEQPVATSPPTELLNGVRAQLRAASHTARTRGVRRANALDELRALTDPQEQEAEE